MVEKSHMQYPHFLQHPQHLTFQSPTEHQGQGLTYFLRASDQQIHHLAGHLALYLNGDQAVQLADHLLSSIVGGSGSGAVWSSMSENLERFRWSCFPFLRELLIMWKHAVPQAHARKVRAVIAGFDQDVTQRCFPSFPITCSEADIHSSPMQTAEIVDVDSEEGRQRLLLAIRCFEEFSVAIDSKPLVTSLLTVLQENGLEHDRCSFDSFRLPCYGVLWLASTSHSSLW